MSGSMPFSRCASSQAASDCRRAMSFSVVLLRRSKRSSSAWIWSA
jgi:hypothetical protein